MIAALDGSVWCTITLTTIVHFHWGQATTKFNDRLALFPNTVKCFILSWFCQPWIVFGSGLVLSSFISIMAALTQTENKIDPITRTKYPVAPSVNDTISIKYNKNPNVNGQFQNIPIKQNLHDIGLSCFIWIPAYKYQHFNNTLRQCYFIYHVIVCARRFMSKRFNLKLKFVYALPLHIDMQ